MVKNAVNKALALFDNINKSEESGFELKINIGGVICSLTVANEKQAAALKDRYAKFLHNPSSGEKCDIIITVYESDEWDADAFEEIQVRYIDSKHYAFRWDFYSLFDAESGKGSFISVKDTNILSIDAFVRITYSLIAVTKGGFLLHSAAIKRNGGGYIFAGVSDSGKTTVARLAMDDGDNSDQKVLTDEITLVKPKGDNYNVYGTPFWGELQHGLSDSAKLKGVMFLTKDEEVKLVNLSKTDAMAKLMKNVLFFAKDKELSTKLFENCYDAVMNFESYNLHFKKDNSFWRYIDDEHFR